MESKIINTAAHIAHPITLPNLKQGKRIHWHPKAGHCIIIFTLADADGHHVHYTTETHIEVPAGTDIGTQLHQCNEILRLSAVMFGAFMREQTGADNDFTFTLTQEEFIGAIVDSSEDEVHDV